MKNLIAVTGPIAGICALALAGVPAQAEEASLLPQSHIQALACTENLDVTTTWGQCLGVIFAPCMTETVGDTEHVACLDGLRREWSASVQNLRGEVMGIVSTQGASELTEMMGAWTGLAVQKCGEAANARPEDMREAARLGCEVTEIVGLAEELAACVEGRSSADYCKLEN